MKIVSVADAKAKLSQYLDEAASTGPVVITRNGKTAAVLIAPSNDDDLERLLLAHSPKFQAMLEQGRAQAEASETVPFDAFWRETERRQSENLSTKTS
jgi:prevent-host-death family protein